MDNEEATKKIRGGSYRTRCNKMNYNLKDISVVIPTYNRPEEMKKMLKGLPRKVKEIIVVDQSIVPIDIKSDDIIKYYHRKIPSITMARNFGVSKAKGKIICFLDDDVLLGDNYFESILDLFSKYPKAEGVAGYVTPDAKLKGVIIDTLIKRPIGLGCYDLNSARVKSTYNITYAINLKKDIQTEWLPGLNMVFKREVFDKHNMRFDENLLGYTLAEDIDFTYRIYKRNNEGLILSPTPKIHYEFSNTSRPTDLRMSFINNVDHIYFYCKNLSDMPFQRCKLLWSLGFIFLGKTLLLLSFRTKSFIKWKNFIKTISYCYSNLDKIKEGDVREWQKYL